LFGVVVGFVLSMITPMTWIDYLFPVVEMQATVVNKTPSEVIVSLKGTKNRDCKYVSIDAFSRHGDTLRDLNMVRVDRPEEGGTKPKGYFYFGDWRIWPTTDTKTVLVYVQYDCSGRDVFVQAAEVTI